MQGDVICHIQISAQANLHTIASTMRMLLFWINRWQIDNAAVDNDNALKKRLLYSLPELSCAMATDHGVFNKTRNELLISDQPRAALFD